MSSTLDDIEQQEEDIFGQLSCYDYIEPLDEDSTRSKALKQLAVSEDSPFARTGDNQAEMRRIRDERAAILSKETNEIRRQLEAVKSRLNELKGKPEVEKPSPPIVAQTTSNQPTIGQRLATLRTKVDDKGDDEPKLRPLTGKADCPNCSCDRRNSVCGKCAHLNSNYRLPRSSDARPKQAPVIQRNYIDDNRPIRPAPATSQFCANKLATVNKVVTTVDDKLVPNQVYTISKSLNEKRTKLAQAIDDLQLMINKVREKDGRLDKERKLVELYKKQWKYGPNIGGPKASSRERLSSKSSDNNRNYRSRLDPDLIRDSKSLLGFNHIEPGLKLRQYSKSPSIYRPTTARKTNSKQLQTSRSKSLESLRSSKLGSGATVTGKEAGGLEGKSVSDINLAPANDDHTKGELSDASSSSDDSVVDCRDPVAEPNADRQDNQREEERQEQQRQNNEDNRQDKMQKMSWIPVFGETEVKTIKRASKRKVQIMDLNDKPSASGLQTSRGNPQMVRNNSTILKAPSRNVKSRAGQRPQDNRGNTINRVMLDANKKLQLANNLLEREKQDCANRNQLVINRSRQPQVRQSQPKQTTTSMLQETKETSKEIARLEELVTEQQKLLAKLVQQQEQQQRLVSPITVSCSSPCLHHLQAPPTMVPVQPACKQGHNRIPTGNKTLINNMREKLSKTKIRLAKTLEAEREKHQRLQLKVDSSLRKQSDLENENELLKQSLSKCIDTCLKDISNTFESLSATLTDSINKQPDEDETTTTTTTTTTASSRLPDSDSGSAFSNAAQLISDNRYLKQMRSHIETIEQQRRSIFDELSREKQKSNQLELQLKQSKMELDQLAEAKQRLESQMQSENCATNNSNSLPLATDQPAASTSKQQTDSTADDADDTYNSVELYRRFVESMSPDIESIRQERKLILNEFDNIKKMLSDINATEK